jgi:ribosome-binding factor A
VRHILATHLLTADESIARTFALTKVEMSPDLRYAEVFWEPRFVVPGMEVTGSIDPSSVNEFFEHAAKKLRTVLAKELGIRYVPELRFTRDETSERRLATEELLRRAREKDGRTDEPIS